MKTLTTPLVFACVACVGQVPAEAPKAKSNDPAVVDAVKQIEQDMGQAMVAGDIDKLADIYADDFATVGSSGEVITKKNLLVEFESFHDKLASFDNGPMDVEVFGDVALVQGSVKERRTRNGEDTSGQFAWMDLLRKRAGKWVVVRSASARVTIADSSEAQPQDPAAIETIRKFEQDIGDAMVAFDVDKLDQAYADDWVTIGSDGNIFKKEGLVGDFKTQKHRLMSFDIGPMSVQVIGDVALVQASVSEKRTQDGKDISGVFAFMDLLKKRAGRWVIVRTLGTKVTG